MVHRQRTVHKSCSLKSITEHRLWNKNHIAKTEEQSYEKGKPTAILYRHKGIAYPVDLYHAFLSYNIEKSDGIV